MEKLCRMNIDIAFYLKGNTEELMSNKHFGKLRNKIQEALQQIVDDVEIDYDSFEVLD